MSEVDMRSIMVVVLGKSAECLITARRYQKCSQELTAFLKKDKDTRLADKSGKSSNSLGSVRVHQLLASLKNFVGYLIDIIISFFSNSQKAFDFLNVPEKSRAK
jgi:hypothetical protein